MKPISGICCNAWFERRFICSWRWLWYWWFCFSHEVSINGSHWPILDRPLWTFRIWPFGKAHLVHPIPSFRRDYGAKVLGFDLSVNMIDIAQERLGSFSKNPAFPSAMLKIRFGIFPKLFENFLKTRFSKTWFGSRCEIRSTRRDPNWISRCHFWCYLLQVTNKKSWFYCG